MTTTRLPVAPAAGLMTAAVTGVAAGVLTAYLQGVVSADWNTIANSGAVWTVVAFAVAAAVGRTQATAVAAGLLALVGEDAGYYLYIGGIRHIPVVHYAEVFWTVAAIWIGPLIGLAAFRARWGSAEQRMTAFAILAGVVAGEGCYLIRLASVPTAGWVEVVLAATLASWAITTGEVPSRARSAALATGAITAVAVYLAYRSLAFG
jgi:hypothetical protein